MEKSTIDLENQLDKDSKELARLIFDDLPTEDEWISIQFNLLAPA